MERFVVSLTPVPTAARVARQRRALKWRIVSTAMSLGILAAIYSFRPPEMRLVWHILFIGAWLGSSLFWLAANIVRLHLAKRDLARIEPRPCLTIEPEGMAFHWPTVARLRWSEITAVRVASGGAAGPKLAVDARNSTVDVPLSFLDASPAVLDGMIRALSLGEHSIEARKLELSV
ncbi:hypothetical protein [Tessaracoccus sp. OH4464_COT-324]|uniref:hypothetical protein n=1 Tax=Tessaracoccus sp. OH4464_COT-324 TaxID=2491059 RepID=UPI000F642716|nr:hypothetical protein [Tessaracoccus sp. OH4464_COT-324]RRD47297.1 hypothetical protein EII42_03290 [Tessaracoccus sp. OH4464_COT-324]